MSEYIPIVALNILHHPKDRPNHNKDAGKIEDTQVFVPRVGS